MSCCVIKGFFNINRQCKQLIRKWIHKRHYKLCRISRRKTWRWKWLKKWVSSALQGTASYSPQCSGKGRTSLEILMLEVLLLQWDWQQKWRANRTMQVWAGELSLRHLVALDTKSRICSFPSSCITPIILLETTYWKGRRFETSSKSCWHKW